MEEPPLTETESARCPWHPRHALPCPVCYLRSFDSPAEKERRRPLAGKGLGEETKMSWSGNCEIPAYATPEDLDRALAAMAIHSGTADPKEVDEAVRGAKECAKQLLYSGAFGALPMAAGSGYRISLSGHANPGHRPTTGWSNDCVTVTIAQTLPAPPP